MVTKAKARKNALNIQKEYASQNYSDDLIIEKISNHHKYREARVVAMYYPTSYEVNLLKLLSDKKTYVVPKTSSNRKMDFIIFNSNTIWEKNKFGINEPKDGKIITTNIDLMLVPTLAVNKDLFRLGHGGGFYDTYLSDKPNIYTIGIMGASLTLNFDSEPHDHKLNEVIFKEELKW